MKRAALVATLVLPLGACISGSSVGPESVIQLAACPPEGVACDPATLIADGMTPIGIGVSTPAQAPRTSPLDATVTLSAGTWVAVASPATPTVATVSLTAQDERVLAFVPPTAPGYVQVSATLSGFTTTLFLTLNAAPLAPPDVETSPTTIGAANSVRVTATVHAASGGSPSDGTRLSFTVDSVTPAGTLAFFSPSSVSLQPDHTASATLTVDAMVTSVQLRIRAVPPDPKVAAADTVVGVVRQ